MIALNHLTQKRSLNSTKTSRPARPVKPKGTQAEAQKHATRFTLGADFKILGT